ncbi:hypothetical protein [Nocardioides sp. NPDC047086]|uniref:hypothetical protein n=1 Tax=Nocardioides sp. NPDC047086 TaxID=3154810 RepID=UPI0033E2F6E2
MSRQPLPAEGPDDPEYTGETEEVEQTEETGQVSEAENLDADESGTPIAPSDATAGYPRSESGSPDTQGSGPGEAPPENRRDNET